MNHAVAYNHERAEKEYQARREAEERMNEIDPVMTEDGLRYSELEKDSDRWAKTLCEW